MTYEASIRRIGWIAVLAVCVALYLALHLKVHSVNSDIVRAERRIVALEGQAMMLETEYLTRSSQLQLARWNRMDLGYRAPEASQFIEGERQLAMLSQPPLPAQRPGEPALGDQGEVQLAANMAGESDAARPQVLSPLTGEPVDPALLLAGRAGSGAASGPRLAMAIPEGPTRIQLNAVVGVPGR